MTEEKNEAKISMERVESLIALTRERKEAEKQVEKIKKKIAAVERELLDEMLEAEMQHIKLKTGETLYLRRSVLCSKKGGIPNEIVFDALRQAQMGWLIQEQYAVAKLKEWVREQEEEHGIDIDEGPEKYLPDQLKPLFNIYERMSVIVSGA